MNTPGRKFLKVVGVLYIVFAGIDLLFGLIGMDESLVGSLLEEATGVSLPLIIIGGLYHLFVGIMGVKFCSTLEKASILMIIGIIDLVWDCINLIINFQWMYLAGLALPILFIIGAYKNKNSLRDTLNVNNNIQINE